MAAEKTGWEPSKMQVAAFLNGLSFGVISSLGPDGQPQAANVSFSQNEKLELLIGTDEKSRKAVNIGRDNRVAFVVTDFEKRYTFQLEGDARRLSEAEFDQHADAHFAKLPGSLPFRHVPGQASFLITPTWARFSDCSVHPWVVTEFTFE